MQRAWRVFVVVTLTAASIYAQSNGRIVGRISRDGAGIAGVAVVLADTSLATATDATGGFAFDSVAPGTYTLTFTSGDKVETAQVTVVAGETARVERDVDWRLDFSEEVTVYAASRRAERIVEAPAAVSVVTEEELELNSSTGQLPKVLESAPGVDFTQSGLYDFNFNTRGFNSSLNRRILTLIDGRDPSVPFLGAQEWAALSYPVDEMASVELVRGPGSALYGANAFSGVLNMTTKQPRYSTGGKVQLTGGDLDTRRLDLRYADEIGGGWFYRLVGGYQESEDFTLSRNVSVEYTHICGAVEFTNCLRREAVPLASTDRQILFGGLRLDRHFAGGQTFTIEAGGASLEGPTFQTGIGRVQVTDAKRPWARINFNTAHWNALAYYDARKADEQIALASGARLYEDSSNLHGELQGNWSFFGERARVVAGGAVNYQEIDTAAPNGIQSLMAESKSEEQQAVFAQIDYDLTKALKAVVAARWDDSTLHESRVSPKASLVYSFLPSHSLRATYNEAFQVPNYSEFFLTAPAGAPVNLSALETALRPFLGGVPLGFQFVPILARGNAALGLEEITSYELGYSGVYGGKLYVTADLYQSHIENFVTDLLPGVNPLFPAYQPPAVLPAPVRTIILQQLQRNLPASAFRGMTNLPNGAPAIVFSYANAGEVDTQGVELGANYYITNHWLVDGNYSWFDFDVKEQGLGDVLLPNAPENKFNLGVGYRGPSFDASLRYRWVDEFVWAVNIFQGLVPEYDVVNFAANYRFLERFTVGLNVSNLLDEEHYESFGGDILERRALVSLAYSW